MELTGIIVFACMAAVLANGVKTFKSGFDTYIILASSLFILFYIVDKVMAIMGVVGKLESYINLDEEYMVILLKIVGISYITQFASDMCKDLGYGTMSNQIQIFGKMSVIVISLPIVMSLIETMAVML